MGPRGVHASAPLWSANEEEHAMPRSAFPPSFARDLLERDRSLMSKAHRLWNTPAEVTHPASISRPPEFVFFDDFISALAFSSSHAFCCQ